MGLPSIPGFAECVALKNLNTWRVGGQARCFFEPHSVADWQRVVTQWASRLPIIMLGLGSNVLFGDGLLDVLVIRTRFLQGLSQKEGYWLADCGVPCAKLAKRAVRGGAARSAFFAGIPGTVGGALMMNAGAFQESTWHFVEAVDWLRPCGTIERLSKADFKVGYRHVEPPYPGWFVRAYFAFPQDHEDGTAKLEALLKKRNASQPIGTFNCGSVFRNPEGDFAARLIEASGLKAYRQGYAQVSVLHANFIENLEGQSDAVSIVALMQHIVDVVARDHCVYLQPEVKMYVD